MEKWKKEEREKSERAKPLEKNKNRKKRIEKPLSRVKCRMNRLSHLVDVVEQDISCGSCQSDITAYTRKTLWTNQVHCVHFQWLLPQRL